MANTKIADIQADFTPFAELLGLGVADKRIRPGDMAQNERAARRFSFLATVKLFLPEKPCLVSGV